MKGDKEDNKRKALIKLILWLLFIGVIVIISFVGSKDKDDEENNLIDTSISYEEKLDKLSSNFAYKYTITIDDLVYNYEGKILDKEDVGTYSFNDYVINYYKNKGYIYKVDNGNLSQITDLYVNINYNYIDISYLKTLIEDQEYFLNDNVYEYTLTDVIIKVSVDDENIESIEVITNNSTYLLEFSAVNQISEITY